MDSVNTALVTVSGLLEAIRVSVATKEDVEQIVVSFWQRMAENMDQPTVLKDKPIANESDGSRDHG